MSWEDLLHSLWDLLAERGSAELEKRIRDLLKERATDEWLRSCEQILRDGRLDQAKSLVSDFLRDHPDLLGIRKRLELILLFERRKSDRSPARKARNREQLLQTVNSLASSGKLVAAEELLEEALAEEEDPELLDLLGRIYMLQRRPQQAAGVMQRALLARRQQAAFVAPSPQVHQAAEVDDEAVTAADLNYIATDAKALAGLDAAPAWLNEGVESVESQPDEPPSAGLGQVIESSHGNDTIISPDSTPETEEQQTSCVEGRKTLSLGKARKSAGMALTPQGVKILVRHAPLSKAAPPQPTAVSVTDTDPVQVASPSDGLPVLESTVETTPRPACSENFYRESDIQDLVGDSAPDGRDDSQSFLKGSQTQQEDDYEPDDDFFGHDDFLTEQVEIDAADMAYEPAIDVGEIEDEYAAYAFDPDDLYDTLDALESDTELSDGRVSREDRALQKAVDLISKVGWPLSVLPLIQQIFVMNGWGATRLALEREIEKGMTPEELILAAHVKVVWSENDYYWIAYDRSGSSSLSQYVLSWPTALLLVRAFESLPQLEELEHFVESLYEYWYERPHLRRAFRSFNRFMWFRMSNLQGCLPANQPFSFGSPHVMPVEEYSDLGVNDPLEIERTAQLRAFGVFQTKHPQEPGCYFSDKPLPTEDDSAASEKKKSPDEASDDELAVPKASTPNYSPSRPDPRNLEERLAMFDLLTEKDVTFDA